MVAVDARDVFIGRAIRLAAGIARKAVRRRFEEILRRAVRVRPHHDEQGILVSRVREFAAVQELGTILQRELALARQQHGRFAAVTACPAASAVAATLTTNLRLVLITNLRLVLIRIRLGFVLYRERTCGMSLVPPMLAN